MFYWKILEMKAADDLITAVKYFCSITDNKDVVETEGWCEFLDPIFETQFVDVTEEMVIEWVQLQMGEQVMSQLKEQMQTLKKENTVIAPWLPQVFTPNI